MALPLWGKHKSHLYQKAPLRRSGVVWQDMNPRVRKGGVTFSLDLCPTWIWCSPETDVAQEVSMTYTSTRVNTPPPQLLPCPFLPPETICMSSLSVQLSAGNDTRWWGLSYAVNCLAQADTFLANRPWYHLRPRSWGGTYISMLFVTI